MSYPIKPDMVFSVELHLSLIPYPFPLNPYPQSPPLVPYPLVLFHSRNLGGDSCSCSSCSSCDRGKTKSTPSPETEVWTLDLGLKFDKSLDLHFSKSQNSWHFVTHTLFRTNGFVIDKMLKSKKTWYLLKLQLFLLFYFT